MTSNLSVKISLALILLIVLILIGLFVALYPIFTIVMLAAPGGKERGVVLLYLKILFFSAGIGALFVAVGFSLLFGQRIAKPLREMEEITSSIVDGDYHRQVRIRGNDELAKLGAGINRLAKHLAFLENTRKEFLSHIAHELRTPLSYIRGYSQAISEGLMENEVDKLSYLNIIHEESVRLSQLIEDLFTLAQSDAGEMSVHLEPFSADGLISSIMNHLQPNATANEVRMTANLNAPGTFLLDPMRMRQVVMNLLDNSLRYVNPTGEVIVETKVYPDHLMMAFQNSGDPIPSDDIPHIFDRLYRVEKSRTRQTGGSGLGLAIVKQIVELHEGTITVTSSIDMGTRFVILLPFHAGEKVRDHYA